MPPTLTGKSNVFATFLAQKCDILCTTRLRGANGLAFFVIGHLLGGNILPDGGQDALGACEVVVPYQDGDITRGLRSETGCEPANGRCGDAPVCQRLHH